MNGSRVGGGCLCGAVRYSIALPARWVAHCHCSMCRRAHGAAFVTWVGNVRENVRIEKGAELMTVHRSSPAARRSFCSRCGSMLFFESTQWPDELHVTLAHLDDATGLEPQAHAYWKDHVAWGDWTDRKLRVVEPPDHNA